MGMAASQVRFLSLQNRKNTIGLNLMTLSNRKMALSRDMSRIANEYNNAMNLKTLKWSGDSGITYSDLNYDILMKPNNLNSNLPYIVTDEQGRVVLDDTEIVLDGYENKNNVTYRDLAMMISAYSGLDDQGHTTYNNLGNLTGGENITSEDIKGGVVGNDAAEAKASSGKANELGYEIISTANQTGSNSLRYDLMEQLGLISKADVDAIEDLELELYGPSRNPEADTFPVGSLMGNYYLALAHLEAYTNFLEHGDYTFAGGAADPNRAANANGSAEDKHAYSKDGNGEIIYENDYSATGGTSISFNGQSTYLSKVDLNTFYDKNTDTTSALTTQNGDVFVGANDQLSYTINNGKIEYDYSSSSLLTAMGKVDTTDWYSKKTWGANRTNGSEINDSTSWAELISQNRMIETYISGSFDRGNQSDNAVSKIVDSLNESVKNNGTIAIDTEAADKAAASTKAFFSGDITNNGSIYSDWLRPAHSQSTVEKHAINRAEESNLIGGERKGDWFLSPPARTYQAISARNLYNTYITFYNYYYNVPTANAILDGSGGSFESVTVTPKSYSADDYETGGETFTYNGQKYIRKKLKTDDGSEVYDYYKLDAGNNIVGTVVQTDIINGEDVSRSIYNSDNTVNNYTMKTPMYNLTNNKKIIGSTGWTASGQSANGGDDSGATAVPSGDVLILSYTDQNGNRVEYKLGNMVSDSVYATNIDATPVDSAERKAELQQAVDDAKKAVDDAETKKARYFDSTENKMMDYFDALFKMIAENGWVYDASVNNPNDKQGSQDYLNAKLQNNMYFITEVDTLDGTDFNYATKLANNVSKIFEVYDKDAQNAALSKYEADKADITAKEKQVDIRMNKLEAEQDAISTELDSIKKIIDDNVSNTFKIFT